MYIKNVKDGIRVQHAARWNLFNVSRVQVEGLFNEYSLFALCGLLNGWKGTTENM